MLINLTEDRLRNFEFWGGAIDNAKQLLPGELDELGDILCEFHSSVWTEEGINDLMWHDFEYICDLLELRYDESSGDIERD